MNTDYTALVPLPDRAAVGVAWTAGERNVRVPVEKPFQEAPDPIREGATPSRPAQVQVVTFANEMNASMAEDFTMGQGFPEFNDGAWTPYGRQAPWVERSNTAPPQHVAYGSLFQYDPYTYGY